MPSEKWQTIDSWSYLKADIKSFSEEQENVNMEKKTLYDLKLFKEFLTSEDERRELQEISAAKLTRCRNSGYFIIKYTFKHLKTYVLFVLQVYF